MYTVYSKDNCPQCRIAVAMLKAKSLEHRVLKLDVDYTKEDLQAIVPNVRSVPQVVHDAHGLIGAVDELRKHISTL